VTCDHAGKVFGPVLAQDDPPLVAWVCAACGMRGQERHRGPCRLAEYRRLTGWTPPAVPAKEEPRAQDEPDLFGGSAE
jgi:hypothetical protein